MSKHKKLDR